MGDASAFCTGATCVGQTRRPFTLSGRHASDSKRIATLLLIVKAVIYKGSQTHRPEWKRVPLPCECGRYATGKSQTMGVGCISKNSIRTHLHEGAGLPG